MLCTVLKAELGVVPCLPELDVQFRLHFSLRRRLAWHPWDSRVLNEGEELGPCPAQQWEDVVGWERLWKRLRPGVLDRECFYPAGAAGPGATGGVEILPALHRNLLYGKW